MSALLPCTRTALNGRRTCGGNCKGAGNTSCNARIRASIDIRAVARKYSPDLRIADYAPALGGHCCASRSVCGLLPGQRFAETRRAQAASACRIDPRQWWQGHAPTRLAGVYATSEGGAAARAMREVEIRADREFRGRCLTHWTTLLSLRDVLPKGGSALPSGGRVVGLIGDHALELKCAQCAGTARNGWWALKADSTPSACGALHAGLRFGGCLVNIELPLEKR